MLFKRLKALDGDHLRIAKGALRVAFFLFIGKIAGALKEMAVANRYGVSDVVDAYQFTMTMSSWLPTTLVGVFSIVLIPSFVKLRHDSEAEQHRFISQSEGILLLLGVLLSGLTFYLWPWVLENAAEGFSEETKALSQTMIYGFAPTVVMILLIGLSMSRLRARERHINTLLDSLPALFILLWILLSPGDTSVMPLLCGTLIGYLVQTLILQVLAARAEPNRPWFKPSISLSSPYWSAVISAAGVMLVGQVAMSFVGPLDQMIAAKLGENANATLGYAARVLSLIIGLGAASVGRAALPVLADVQAQGEYAKARSMALKWALGMMAAGVLVVALLWVLSPWLVQLLFQRGAFSAENTASVTSVMRYGLLQLPFYFGVLILVQLMASQNRYTLMAAIAVANFALKALLSYYLAPIMGAEGIMLATAMMYLLSFSCYFVAVTVIKPGFVKI
ncbi:lipid II flippase MurJ [Oligella sp. MSHR50489EDL]|uniref:murein biosynthesis integral membrane protein MurJ n=1 Tax=Oligella sp. MSHR50489EDL TaxID=3139409 RepID=UPI003D8142BA